MSEGKSESNTQPGAVGRYAVWPYHHGVYGSDDWTVSGTTCSVDISLGMAIPASVAIDESFLLVGSLVVMPAMAMGLGCRWRADPAKHECGACPRGQNPNTVEHRLFATASTVWMLEPELMSEDC